MRWYGMKRPSPEKLREWQSRARLKNAIVPFFFEVFPTKVLIICGECRREFQRNLIPRIDEPTFICPEESCRARNWVPVRFDFK